MSERNIKKRIFTRGGKKIHTNVFPNAIITRFKNTKVALYEDKEIGPEGHKEVGNIIQFLRAQEGDFEAFCFKKKLKVLNGRSTTACEIGLSDEALESLYIMLKIRFEGIPQEWKDKGREVKGPWTDEALRTFIDTWPPEMNDTHLSGWLNEMELPHDQYMMAVDYYKKIGPYGNEQK